MRHLGRSRQQQHWADVDCSSCSVTSLLRVQQTNPFTQSFAKSLQAKRTGRSLYVQQCHLVPQHRQLHTSFIRMQANSSHSETSTTTTTSTGDETQQEGTHDDPEVVAHRLLAIKEEIASLAHKLNLPAVPRLVAVSKTKPNELIKACYDAGHVCFGENYVQELVQKAPQLPEGIQWHFIGHMQSNKCKALASIPNLAMVETVHDLKIAKALDKACSSRAKPLPVMIQINTSGEENKGGSEPEECVTLYSAVVSQCPKLLPVGIMTIGRLGGAPDDDFKKLAACRERICSELNLTPDKVELSMGMSSDYKIAMGYGSTNVRVGSSIFGERNYHK